MARPRQNVRAEPAHASILGRCLRPAGAVSGVPGHLRRAATYTRTGIAVSHSRALAEDVLHDRVPLDKALERIKTELRHHCRAGGLRGVVDGEVAALTLDLPGAFGDSA